MNINPKYTTIIGAILAITGFAYARITGKADVIIMFFTFFLGILLFVIGIAGLLGNWYKGRKTS
ncbi:MAG: hypothetical protein NTZ84_03210 [Candidatus Nealsonbacteria bacterium]|nr:hypothetical protein [Candidatus Nealsonbacteria bacterium]